MATSYFMAVDQYGTTEHALVNPRKELMDRYGTKHARKIYRDKKDGRTVHVGYIVCGHWFELFQVIPFEKD